MRDRLRIDARPGEPDVAVGTQQEERLRRDARPLELARIVRILGNGACDDEIGLLCRRGLPEHEQAPARVVELLEEVLDRAAGP